MTWKAAKKSGRALRDQIRYRRFYKMAEPYLALAIDQMEPQDHNESVLVIAPHADDETLGCGGALALHRKRGDTVHVIYMTDSAKTLFGTEPIPDQAGVRKREALEALKILGGATTDFIGLKDGAAEVTKEAIGALRKTMDDKKPDRIYVPWKLDRHRDHISSHAMLVEAMKGAQLPSNAKVWEYEVWTPVVPNRYIPIGAVIDLKEQAIKAHESQVRNTDFVRSSIGLAYFRGMQGGLGGPGEAYFCISAEKLFLFDAL